MTIFADNNVHSPNALIIHYTSNNHIMRENEMVLVDAGCEYRCVSVYVLQCRTYPNYTADTLRI